MSSPSDRAIQDLLYSFLSYGRRSVDVKWYSWALADLTKLACTSEQSCVFDHTAPAIRQLLYNNPRL